MHDEKLEGALLERFCSEWILRGVSSVKDFAPFDWTLSVGGSLFEIGGEKKELSWSLHALSGNRFFSSCG